MKLLPKKLILFINRVNKCTVSRIREVSIHL